jgi:hypothetical protein
VWFRAKIVLLAADGVSNVRIAERLDVHMDTVSLWRRRFFESCRVAGVGQPIQTWRGVGRRQLPSADLGRALRPPLWPGTPR